MRPRSGSNGTGACAEGPKHRHKARREPPWLRLAHAVPVGAVHGVGDAAADATGFWGAPVGAARALTLHEDVRLLAQYLALTQDEVDMREDLLGRLRGLVHDVWPRATVEVFGSYATALCLPVSDLDIVVNVPDVPSADGPSCGGGSAVPYGTSPMEVLAEALRARAWCARAECLPHARVPIIKAQDALTRLAVDISFNAATGPANSRVVRALLVQHPAARPLVLVLKLLLYTHALNEVYVGGLGSYALCLLVVSFLQHTPLAADAHADLGALLLACLQLYGADFDAEHCGVSVRGAGALFDKRARGWLVPDKPWLLAIEDPAAPANDVGRASYNILQVRQLFFHTHRALLQAAQALLHRRRALSPLSCVIDAARLQAFRVRAVHHFALARSPLLVPASIHPFYPRPSVGAAIPVVPPGPRSPPPASNLSKDHSPTTTTTTTTTTKTTESAPLDSLVAIVDVTNKT